MRMSLAKEEKGRLYIPLVDSVQIGESIISPSKWNECLSLFLVCFKYAFCSYSFTLPGKGLQGESPGDGYLPRVDVALAPAHAPDTTG